MAYEHEPQPKQVILNQPAVDREFVRTESVYATEPRGFSGLAVAALVIGAIALVTVVFLVLMNSQNANTNDNRQVAREQPPQVIVQQPATQPATQQPVVVQPSAPVSAPAPVVIQQPAPSASRAELDSYVQAEFERRMMEDPVFSGLSVTASAVEGKVTLTGSVPSQKLKSDLEKMLRDIKFVKNIDNQILVTAS
jgi:hypothetical protein